MEVSISDFLPYYPSIDGDDFNEQLNSKSEFNYPKVEETQSFPAERGDLMSHQTIISRIMSSYTPYDGMLLMHEMGTGKTCSAIAIMEQLRSEKNGINKFVYVCSNTDLKRNFEAEFKNVCTDGKYSDISLASLKITTQTYGEFVPEQTLSFFKNTSGSVITKAIGSPFNLDNCLVIIDEVHNITGDKRDAIGTWFNNSKNVKLLLMSGTPMTDTPVGIAHVMNMILPVGDKLDTNEEFFENIQNNKDEFVRKIRGRISYIKSPNDDSVVKVFKGEKLASFEQFKLCKSVMSEHQTSYYKTALAIDTGSPSPAYTKSLQAAQFVDENGDYGTNNDKPFTVTFKKDGSVQDKLKQLRKYSSKYAASIETILDTKNKGKNILVFNKSVNGGGLSTFASILRQFGIQEAKYNALGKMTKQRRFVTLTGEKKQGQTGDWKQEVVNRFNKNDNKNGDYINIILASDAISEGYSFKNIQIIDIHSPWFQFAKISQAIARGLRFNSHAALLDNKTKTVNVDIYLRVSVSYDTIEVADVDIIAYKFAEEKDIIVKKVEHIIKKESIDSLINLERNRRDEEYDNLRECEYTECKYSPFENENWGSNSIRTDDTNNVLLYGVDNDKKADVFNLFEVGKQLNFFDILKKSKLTNFMLLSILHHIISNDEPVEFNGIRYYLREQHNTYYLTQFTSNKSSVLDVFYEYEPVVKKINIKREFLVSDVFDNKSIKDIPSLKKATVNNVENEQLILEHFILNKKELTSNPVLEPVMEYFKGLYGEIDGVTYTWFNFCKTIPRKMVKQSWVNCTDIEIERVKTHTIDIKKAHLKKYDDINKDNENENSFVGMFDYEKTGKKVFKLLVVTKDIMRQITDPTVEVDNRKIPTGINCATIGSVKQVQEYVDEISTFMRNANGTAIPPSGKKDNKTSKCAYIEKILKENNLYIRAVEKRPVKKKVKMILD